MPPQDLPGAPHFSLFSSLLSGFPVLCNGTLTGSLPNLIKELGSGLREDSSILKPSQTSNELPASPRSESLLQRYPPAEASTRHTCFLKQRSKSSQIPYNYETPCYNKQPRTVYIIRQSPRHRSPSLVQTAHIPPSHRLASSEHART